MGSLLLASKCNILPGMLVEMEPKVEFAAGRFLLVFYLGDRDPFLYFHKLGISVG
jgi:hypothetical protein